MIDAKSFESRFPLQETPETGRLPWVKNCAQACRLDWTREIVCLWSSGVGIYYSFLFGFCSKIRWLPMLTMMCQPWCSNCRSCPAGLQPRLKITRSSHILPSGHSQAWAQTLNMGATWRGTFTGGFVAFTVSNSNRTPFTSTSRLLCWPKKHHWTNPVEWSGCQFILRRCGTSPWFLWVSRMCWNMLWFPWIRWISKRWWNLM